MNAANIIGTLHFTIAIVGLIVKCIKVFLDVRTIVNQIRISRQQKSGSILGQETASLHN